ncbi:2-amino-4-hydroxy-6-hydroxymethyldihydropteridine diphosphokinase [Tersicoccus phoenicis]|uniref:2-amino-4-hydroxy-6-hydroxymethyldihydropteridine diphosphokinase n=1 Tax=Tersicoccus phoenicis TaxID=554083 RepID=A0A1R1LD31_9MICC|nr:2-amino-4-hydroxy-6-hydroxymethyldihydropteridine diphosphokinase [Tersicoccus phoenicis]OMH25441.1 2-amino-4-hydroxy-6-hydroxymethyldihydropteridine diphosphokinase [Tersicoccus phoenicis]
MNAAGSVNGGSTDARAEAILALGANLGDPTATLTAAVRAIAAEPGLTVLAVSPAAVTAPVGGPPGQPDYRNLVLRVATGLSPEDLLAACHRIEARFGRERVVRWGPRTLDVDIVTVVTADGEVHRTDPELTLPHASAAGRGFVLAPWSWMEPEARLDGVPVTDLLAAAPDRDGVHRAGDRP